MTSSFILFLFSPCTVKELYFLGRVGLTKSKPSLIFVQLLAGSRNGCQLHLEVLLQAAVGSERMSSASSQSKGLSAERMSFFHPQKDSSSPVSLLCNSVPAVSDSSRVLFTPCPTLILEMWARDFISIYLCSLP